LNGGQRNFRFKLWFVGPSSSSHFLSLAIG
jgi:hypothetical protein